MSRPLPPSISSPVIVWCIVGLLITACSGLSAPSPSALHTAQVTIRSTGAMPSDQTIPDPAEVVFYVVDDSRHEIYSGPHPGHTGCPALNIGAVGPNANRKTGTIHIGTCQFHDDLNPGDARFQGTIRVQ